MCYHTKLTADEKDIAKRLKAEFLEKDKYVPNIQINGFELPKTPIVTCEERNVIQFYEWGLAGDYLAKQGHSAESDQVISARRNCLNAQLETLTDKTTFKDHVNKRCIVPMQGMYEWQWAEPGNDKSKKTKYIVSKPDNSVFSCAGIYNIWQDPKTKLFTYCYTICTTEGNALMKEIKNEGERMLVVLNEDEQDHWLNPAVPYMAFWDRSHIELKAELAPHIPVKRKLPPTKNNLGTQTSLF